LSARPCPRADRSQAPWVLSYGSQRLDVYISTLTYTDLNYTPAPSALNVCMADLSSRVGMRT